MQQKKAKFQPAVVVGRISIETLKRMNQKRLKAMNLKPDMQVKLDGVGTRLVEKVDFVPNTELVTVYIQKDLADGGKRRIYKVSKHQLFVVA